MSMGMTPQMNASSRAFSYTYMRSELNIYFHQLFLFVDVRLSLFFVFVDVCFFLLQKPKRNVRFKIYFYLFSLETSCSLPEKKNNDDLTKKRERRMKK